MTFSRTFLCAASTALLLAGCKAADKAATDAKQAVTKTVSEDTVPHAQLGSNVNPVEYRLDMVMNPDDDGFQGVVEIDVTVEKATNKIWLHGKHMTVTGAVAELPGGESIPLTFQTVDLAEAPSGVAYITSEETLPSGAMTLKIPYETPYNMSLNSAYKVTQGGENYIVTQFEPLGAREAFPSFDEPRFKVPFTLSITSPADDFVFSNTPELKATTLENGWVKHDFAKTPPLPTYLIAFGSGPYDVVEYDPLPPTDVRARPIPLRIIAAKGKGGKTKYAANNTAGIMEALEAYFDIPYPYKKLDLIAAPDYAFGAMENPGAIVYREYLLLLDDNAPLSQQRAYASVHSHELAHQWFGDLVTPVWWEDIWLNEAFATWMGNKGIAEWKPDGNFDRNTLNSALGAMNIDTLSTTRKVREPLERSEGVMDQFDGITYRKGGGVLSMFESFVGEEKFRDGVRLHMKRYADGVATGDDFFESIADGSGNADVVPAMKSFVDQPGLPLVSAKLTCANEGKENSSAKLSLSQSRYAPLGSKTKQGQTWQIPVCVTYGIEGGSGKECTLMKKKTATLDLPVCTDWVTLNNDGAGYYRFTMDTAAWDKLLSNLGKLNTREVLTVQDSLVAAYRAGEVDSSVFLKGMEVFAKHPEYDVARGAGSLLGFMSELLDAEDDVARLVRDMFQKRYNDNVGKDTVEGNLLVPTLASRLVNVGQDETLKLRLAQQGAAYLGVTRDQDKTQVASNMIGLALSQAMKSLGDATYGPLIEMASSGSALEKGVALGALASTTDKEIAATLRDVALAEDSPITGRQSLSLIGGLIGSDIHGDDTWEWLKTNFEPFVKRKVADVRLGGMPGFAGGFCSAERRDEVQAFFTDNAALIPGYERSLAQTVERIELCAALKEAKAEELTAALKAR